MAAVPQLPPAPSTATVWILFSEEPSALHRAQAGRSRFDFHPWEEIAGWWWPGKDRVPFWCPLAWSLVSAPAAPAEWHGSPMAFVIRARPIWMSCTPWRISNDSSAGFREPQCFFCVEMTKWKFALKEFFFPFLYMKYNTWQYKHKFAEGRSIATSSLSKKKYS